MIECIYKMGGISVILVHPDYELANRENIECLDKFLESIHDQVKFYKLMQTVELWQHNYVLS